jgi:hypothetical protein
LFVVCEQKQDTTTTETEEDEDEEGGSDEDEAEDEEERPKKKTKTAAATDDQGKGKEKEKPKPLTLDEAREQYEKIAELSNRFYELIPHSGYTVESIPPLDNEELLNQKVRLSADECLLFVCWSHTHARTPHASS